MPTEDELTALSAFLGPWGGHPEASMLQAAIGDADNAFRPHHDNEGRALWLATLGYLIAVDVLGKYVQRGTPSPSPSTSPQQKAFVRTVMDFAPHHNDEQSGSAFYALRCTIAHEFGLRNPHSGPAASLLSHVFRFEDSGDLLTMPEREWDGDLARSWDSRYLTRVNLMLIPEFVHSIVEAARIAHAARDVELASGMTLGELRRFGMFRITGPDQLPPPFINQTSSQ